MKKLLIELDDDLYEYMSTEMPYNKYLEDQFISKVRWLVANASPLNNTTNGGVMIRLFPDIHFYEDTVSNEEMSWKAIMSDEISVEIDIDWWKAPYDREMRAIF